MKYKILNSTTEAILLPTIRKLSENHYGAVFELMKLLPAKFIIDEAEKEGKLKKGGKIIESSSGTFGLALALLAAERGYELTLVSDPVIDKPLKYRLEDLGTKVDIVEKPAVKGGFQVSRLNRLYELMDQNPGMFWPMQYDNKDNQEGYAPFAEQILEVLGSIDYLVASVGSGGSSCGTAKYLKSVSADLKVIGVDSLNSVIFGRPDNKRFLRGLGGSIMPKNVTHSQYDEIHWINPTEGFGATRALHRDHQLYMGPTSGAVYMVAKHIAENNKNSKVLGIFADTGYRYEMTVYSDEWLSEKGFLSDLVTAEPKLVEHPDEAGPNWSMINWNKREYKEILGKEFELSQ